MKRVITVVAVVIVVLLVAVPSIGMGTTYWRISHPVEDHQPLPPGLVDAGSDAGKALLAEATDRADYDVLLAAYQPQEKVSWCGVASSTIVLDAMRDGPKPAQDDFFDGPASAVRSWRQVTFGGMNLDALGGLLAAHGLHTEVHHAGDETVDAFREQAAANLARPDDYVLVNYSREPLAQGKSGHISPLAAYDPVADRFLILDVTAYKWPPVWVDSAALYAAMNTVDSDGGKTRGWVLVSR